jgi:hypothetical protein
MLLYSGCTIDQNSIPKASSVGSQSGSSSVFSGVFIAEKFVGTGHKQSAYTTTADTDTLVGLFLTCA